jgi:hypothetical protein
MTAVDVMLPLARAYAFHSGFAPQDEALARELDRRLAPMPPWGRMLAGAGALLVRWIFPIFSLGRFCGFADLSPAERDRVLESALATGFWPVRAAVLACRSVLLQAVYA